jgi:hypothetical protein
MLDRISRHRFPGMSLPGADIPGLAAANSL